MAQRKSKKLTKTEQDRQRRMKWWHDARFGMFIHWGLYSQLGRHEWVQTREAIPVREYEKLADTWSPKPRPAREWARLAKNAGMKYMVMTTKHHEGFCLWDSEQTDYNAVKCAPGRDLVAEYVDACREYGLKIGFYYSLMDWHHPDGARCATDEKARRRFVDFTHGCVRELMSNYGKIDILWYDVSRPLDSPEKWESAKMNRMARKLQPDILINNRSQLPEDFGTPEEHITAEEQGRAWEACMTFNGSWGYLKYDHPDDWHSVRDVIGMLRKVTAGGGNLLLNVGPKPDGSLPELATERLTAVGKWLKKHGEAVYGEVDRVTREDFAGFHPLVSFTRKGRTIYAWVRWWPEGELVIGGWKGGVKKISILSNGKELPFDNQRKRLVIEKLPRSPDRIAEIPVLKIECSSRPSMHLPCMPL